jgi:hypothetical protein
LSVLTGIIIALSLPSRSAKADLFGGDVAVLTQILQENIQQYYQLQQMFQQGQNAQSYLHWINAGLDNSMGLLRSLPIKDDRVLGDVRGFQMALGRVQTLYGPVPVSPEQPLQTLHDQTVAESLRMANDFKDYSVSQEQNSDLIADEARTASPKGAARMQAEMSAQMLKSLSQLIRLNTQMLKLQSEQLAFSNKQSKADVANYQKVSQDLGSGFSNFNPDMSLEKF